MIFLFDSSHINRNLSVKYKGESVIGKLGIRKTRILASFIYAAALFYFVINPSITSCYVVIILFAAADSFGLTAQSVYFISMPEAEKL